jgi:hypothetical protein
MRNRNVCKECGVKVDDRYEYCIRHWFEYKRRRPKKRREITRQELNFAEFILNQQE